MTITFEKEDKCNGHRTSKLLFFFSFAVVSVTLYQEASCEPLKMSDPSSVHPTEFEQSTIYFTDTDECDPLCRVYFELRRTSSDDA